MIQRKRALGLAAALAAALLATLPSTARAQTLADVLSYAQAQKAAQNTSQKTSQKTAVNGLFGTVEFTSASLSALPQWRRILDRMESERPAFVDCTNDPDKCVNPSQRAWRDLQLSAQGLDRAQMLQVVNRFFNRWPYKSDTEVYGSREFWASPSQFMMSSGDCEDYAIAKYFALRQLGFRSDELRVVVLYDRIRAIGHAVLAVYEPDDVLILDSLSNFITSHGRYRHYIPQYSMNETTRWAHVDHSRAIPQTALRANGQ